MTTEPLPDPHGRPAPACAELSTLLARSAALHHHLCPRQVLGVRIGMLAAELLALPLPQHDKRVVAFVETDGCFADGVSVASGCWFGRRTLRLIDYGKIAATFVDTQTSRSFRIAPRNTVREQALHYAPHARSRWHAALEAYRIMPSDELLSAEPVELTLDLNALIGRNGLRRRCERCGEEIINQRDVQLAGRVLCRACADGAYYQPQPR